MFKLTKFKQSGSLSSGVLTQPLPRRLPVSTEPINQHFPFPREDAGGSFHLRRGEDEVVLIPLTLWRLLYQIRFNRGLH